MIFTVGHSTLTKVDFLSLLGRNDIGTLVDIRSHPYSRHVPSYNQDQLANWLPRIGMVNYVWYPYLGGWRDEHSHLADQFKGIVDIGQYTQGRFPKTHIRKKSGKPIGEWTNQGFYDYSWFMGLDEFIDGCDRLIENFGDPDRHCAIMCCEILWWKCHRSMVADYLYFRDVPVWHLQPRVEEHFAAYRLKRYDRRIVARWQAHGNVGEASPVLRTTP